MGKTKATLFQQLQEESNAPVASASWRTSGAVRIVILVMTAVLCAMFFPSLSHLLFDTSQSILLSKGQVWQSETVVAESNFPIKRDESKVIREIETARAYSPVVFTRTRYTLKNDDVRTISAQRYVNTLADRWDDVETREGLIELVRVLTQKEFVNVPLSSVRGRPLLVSETSMTTRALDATSIVDSTVVRSMIARAFRMSADNQLRTIVEKRILADLVPTLQLWPEKTKQFSDAAASNVPRTEGLVRKGEIIITKGEVLTEANIAKLASYGYVRDEDTRNSPHVSYILGSLLHSALVYSLLVLFVYFLRKRIYQDNLQLLSLSVLIVCSAVFSWCTLLFPQAYSLEYAVLIPACAMVAAIYFDSRTGFIITVTSGLMYAAVRANDAGGAFALMLAGTLGAYSVRDLRTRTQLFRSMGFILIGFVLVITATTLERGASPTQQWQAFLWALLNAVASPLITFAVIAVTERYFGVMTDLTLREFDNVNHPLLVQMSEKAPGTYQHTLAIAHLVESAAYTINASPLLARVGAYYHDIGKIAKSEYFIENQLGLDNKHDMISPKKSAGIIRNHVAEGMEIAREYGLPEKIVEFIPMHHGTGLIKHFYAKALEMRYEEGEEVAEEWYRYPGPKPQSKETALVMLADGVEAISRTVDDKESLEAGIDAIFKEKIIDGQFDECDMTMRELSVVKEVFIRNLVGAHHQRVAYKEINKDPS